MTLRSLVRPARLVEVGRIEDRQWFFCTDPDCDVVYFSADGVAIGTADVTVRVGAKVREAPHTVCYCYGHSLESIRAEVATTGASAVVEDVAAKVKAGECRCETLNPKGACCLGDLRQAVKAAYAATGRTPQPRPAPEAVPTHDCGAPETAGNHTPEGGARKDKG